MPRGCPALVTAEHHLCAVHVTTRGGAAIAMLMKGLSKGLLMLAASVVLVWFLVNAFERRAEDHSTATAPTPASYLVSPASYIPMKRT